MRAVNLGILVCAGMLTAACGVKGPLYLPNAPRDAPWPYMKPQPSSSTAPANRSGAPPAAPAGGEAAGAVPAEGGSADQKP